ncbi:MAG TPA: MAPEG family protein [Beijerinckiaceae bacterium]|nr:MAPEG family protein [Beijerinckiaceae bacterium]
MVLVAAILVQVLWTLIVLVMLGRSRAAAVRAGQVKIPDVALSSDAWPDRIKAIGNNYANQFETPVLFYVLAGLALYLGATHAGMALAAWIFVASRIGHTLVHTGGNRVMLRFRIFLIGVAALLAMWLMLALRVAGI